MPVVPSDIAPAAVRPEYQRGGASADAFGAGVYQAQGNMAKAIGNVGDDLYKAALLKQADDNEREAKMLDAEFAKAKRELFYGQAGFYNQQGQNAIDARPAVDAKLEKLKSDVLSKAKSDRVRELFDQQATIRIQGELEAADRYTERERTVANNTAAEARINEAINDASASFNDSKAVAQSEAIIMAEITQQAEANGWDPSVTVSKLNAAHTALYGGAVENALKRGDIEAAKQLHTRYSGMISSKANTEIAATITGLEMRAKKEAEAEAKSIRAEARAQRAEQRAMEAHALRMKDMIESSDRLVKTQQAEDVIMSLGLDPMARLEEARKIKDPELRKSVVAAVEHRNTQERVNKEKTSNHAFSEAALAINKDGVPLSNYLAANPDKAQTIYEDPKLYASLQAADDRRAKGETYARVSDGKSYQGLMSMDAEKLVQTDLQAHRHSLTQTEFGQLVRAQVTAKKLVEGSGKSYEPMKRADTLLRSMAPPALKWGNNRATESDREAQNGIRNYVYSVIDQMTEDGKKPSHEELVGVVNDALQEYVYEKPGMFYSSDTKVFKANIKDLTPGEKSTLRVPVEEADQSIVAALKNDLNKRGIAAPSDDLIEQLLGTMATNDRVRSKQLIIGAGGRVE